MPNKHLWDIKLRLLGTNQAKLFKTIRLAYTHTLRESKRKRDREREIQRGKQKERETEGERG